MNRSFKQVLAVVAVLAVSTAGVGRSLADSVPGHVFVPRATIYPGDLIAPDAVVQVPHRSGVSGAEVYGSKSEDLVGKVARRTLLAGKAVPASAVREPAAVVQGRACDILYKAGALTISGTAVPLKSAAVGEVISARNSETGQVVQAVVQAGGTLLVKSQ